MMTDRVRALADRALGTCDGYVDEIEELTLAECAELDGLVFQCVTCGWWFEAGDAVDTEHGWECGDCAGA